jgi:hypothetical protein
MLWMGTFDIGGNSPMKCSVVATACEGDKCFNKAAPSTISIMGDSQIRLLTGPKCTIESGELTGPTWDTIEVADFKLVGKKLEFTMELNGVGSNLNANLFLIIPSSYTGKGYYCDAEMGCTEIDIIECNQYGATSTLHVCNNTTGYGCNSWLDQPTSGDRNAGGGCRSPDGCQAKSGGHTGWFGVGKLIDPTIAFKVSAQFPETGGMCVEISQNFHSKTLFNCTGVKKGCQLPYEKGKYWANSNQFPDSNTLNDLKTQMKNNKSKVSLIASLWEGNKKSDMDWITQIPLNDESGYTDLKNASLNIYNMNINSI